MSQQGIRHSPDDAREAQKADQHAEAGDHGKRLNGHAGDAVKGQRQHFAERIVALPRQTFVPFIVHAGAFEAHQREQAPEEDIDLLITGKRLQNLRAGQTVVGVVVDHLCAHPVHKAIEALGCRALEPGITVPVGAHTVHHLAAVQIGLEHLIHGIDVILPVAVNGDGDITAILCLHQPRQHRVLVSPVPALANADEMLVLPRKAADQLPGAIPGAVVDKQDAALIVDFIHTDQSLQLLEKHRRRDRQNFFLIVTGNNDV